MSRSVVDLRALDQTQVAIAGGKGAQLGELSRIEGVRVPPGFCVTTDAFRRIVAQSATFGEKVDRLLRLKPDEHEAIRELSGEIRRAIEGIQVPADLARAIEESIDRLGLHSAVAVRSSATAEDTPTASFAGQHDTYLNVAGTTSVLEHVRRCWASLFTERAVTYQLRNGIDSRTVSMAIVVQQMVNAKASGILFTADPVTGNRTVTAVDATLGLGEALVTGLKTADHYKVRDDQVIARPIDRGALTNADVVRLGALGRRIEAHFGRPQDIEWCLDDDGFQIVQSRPITTLFPIPPRDDSEHHVYLSTGHQQMMTDAMKPFGISMWQLMGATVFHEAGGRLFVDVSQQLSSSSGRAWLLGLAGKSDPLTGDALRTVIERGFIPEVPSSVPDRPRLGGAPTMIATDSTIVDDLIERSRASILALKREIVGKTGEDLLNFILANTQELKRFLMDPTSMQAIMAGIEASWWLNDKLNEWLGEKNAADVLTQSVPNNVTSEMGLELLDVADAIRPHPEVVAFLQHVEDDAFIDELPKFAGGDEARRALLDWLDKYGMRCVGEIDITRPRWSERPRTLLPMILGNVRNFERGEGRRRFERGLREAGGKERDVMDRLRRLPEGVSKADETKRMIDRVRTFAGYREYPKYAWISRYHVYKQALLGEAARLVRDRVLRDPEDIFFLTFAELQDVVRTRVVNEQLINERKAAFKSYQGLTPPRVLTSEGESVTGSYRRGDLPDGALVGVAVSAGVVEGRARVILDLANADLELGDILVTRYADPSWTPLFVAARGLVTEVGGLMTHGAVIAREYGLPAVVGVENATRLIRDGQRIRVNGTEGYVEILT